MHFPDHMREDEKQVVNRLLTSILDANFSVSVWDGEWLALRQSRDRAAIQREVAATDITWLRVYHGDKRIGSIMLVHGNGPDVISDTSWNPHVTVDGVAAEEMMERITRPAERYAESLW